MVELLTHTFEKVKLIRLKSFCDERGFFREAYNQPNYEELGIDCSFVQDNHSFSSKGTIRGMHFQSHPGQAKLVTPIIGVIYDVVVDIRPDSPTFGQWASFVLDAEKNDQLFIPVGFAHGFAVLSPTVHLFYKVSTVYNSATEKGFAYNDPEVGIEWPVENPVVSQRDARAPTLREILK